MIKKEINNKEKGIISFLPIQQVKHHELEHLHNMLSDYKMMQDHQSIDSLLVKQLLGMLDKMYVEKDDVIFTSTLIFVSLKDFHDQQQLL